MPIWATVLQNQTNKFNINCEQNIGGHSAVAKSMDWGGGGGGCRTSNCRVSLVEFAEFFKRF